jgi:hypothetical protein
MASYSCGSAKAFTINTSSNAPRRLQPDHLYSCHLQPSRVLLIAIYVFIRRARQQKRLCDFEEGIVKVKEARAMKFMDYNLNGAPFLGKLGKLHFHNSPPILSDLGVPSGVVPHPLFHPGIKRLRLLESPKPSRYQLPCQVVFYPHLER